MAAHDDLYGLQALNLTPHLLQKYFYAFISWSSRVFPNVNWLFVQIRGTACLCVHFHPWSHHGPRVECNGVCVPPWGSNKQNLRQADSCFCWRSCKLWRLLAEDKINTWGHWGEDNHVVCTTRLSGKLMSKAIFINSNGTKTAESIPYWWETRRCEKKELMDICSDCETSWSWHSQISLIGATLRRTNDPARHNYHTLLYQTWSPIKITCLNLVLQDYS